MFLFLESKEPQSDGMYAMPKPREDTLTKAMDVDRKTLATQQKAKKGVNKLGNTVKAITKPITRTKEWLTGIVDSLIKRDEDQVKTELTENASYRSAVFKAARLATKLGLIGVATAIQPWIGVTVAAIEGLKLADRPRLRKEVARNLEIEIKVTDEKIRDLEGDRSKKAIEEKYKLMRIKKDLESQYMRINKSRIAQTRDYF